MSFLKKAASSLILCLFLTWNLMSVSAQTTPDCSYAASYIEEVYPDGSYWEVTIEEHAAPSVRAAQSKSGTKTGKYTDKNGKVLWSVTVSGTFTYNGTSASCTKSSVSILDASINWTVSDQSAWRSGATAYASAIGHEKNSLGQEMRTLYRQVSLTCSTEGKLS